MPNLQAEHGVDTHQVFENDRPKPHAVLVWPGKTATEWLFLTTALVYSSSISFCPVGTTSQLCQSDIFHQSVCAMTRLVLDGLIWPASNAASPCSLAAFASILSSSANDVLCPKRLDRCYTVLNQCFVEHRKGRCSVVLCHKRPPSFLSYVLVAKR